MATCTAQILIGEAHPYHGGINPIHSLFLTENSVPALILVPENVLNSKKSFGQRVVWNPTTENMLEDALLMIALHIIKDNEITNMANRFFTNSKIDRVSLYQDIDTQNLRMMYQLCRWIKSDYKLLISVYEGSSFNAQLPVLKDYQFDVEVCTSQYNRYRSIWSDKVEEHGKLEKRGL